MCALYDKIGKPLKFLFSFMAVVMVAGCVGGPSIPTSDSGVVTNDPRTMPEIRWQTPDQRKILAREKPAESVGEIKWQDTTLNGTVDASTIAAAQNNKDVAATISATGDAVEGAAPIAAQPAVKAAPQKIKVHLLVPLSGDKGELGSSMLNAAQMALFDVGNANLELIPLDTKNSPAGAKAAAEKAIRDGSRLILGPVFSQQLEAVKTVTAAANIPVISFTNDWKQAGDNTYIMGFLPFMQVSRVVKYAQQKGYTTFASFAPKTEYCDVVLKTMQDALNSSSQMVAVQRYASKQNDVASLVADFVNNHKIGNLPENEHAILKDKNDFKLNFDVLMLPMGGEGLRAVINQLELSEIDNQKIQYIGTGLWDDAKLNSFPAMYGAWFAAPDPDVRREFDKNYRDNFGRDPVRIASLAYDATALAAVLVRRAEENASEPFTPEALTNPRGFAGIDGIFRFRESGLSERGLAVLEVRPNIMHVLDRAPTAFVDR